ncbi:NACHT domain-containing NTPase [Nostocaceae cyanobacterium CENA369]|uniref:NACHT domain-containing NTPase n=1 Tax=Dendronalium phyllosphericum CENA369 TaxID=1725256 RepID=A0A8J7IN51_9NOST|nr:NACHT domain-containing NTPase [Dendronalium phyllosphericum]MBH8576917.1 NACHT domain-containing NTPase [Dendronalium phyllosphericum CENA369]
MQPLPCNFLTRIAQKYQLSKEQEDAFVEIYHRGDDELEAAEALSISQSAFRTRMTGVYEKFQIAGKGPGKFYRLQVFLIGEYQKTGQKLPPEKTSTEIYIQTLVKEVREFVASSICERCGKMRVLDMEQPIGLASIYTSVNILEKVTGRQRLKIADLFERCGAEDVERFGLTPIKEQRIDGLEAVAQHKKLMVLGKPGAGKTTFLKRLAMLCVEQHFQAHRVPIFITLKAFAETSGRPSLWEYLPQSFALHQTANPPAELITKLQVILEEGQALILLDGLDEVRDIDSQRIIDEIQRFATQFHLNQFVMTCRIAAREYTFEQFTEVEVADFDDDQIFDFVTKWFTTKQDPIKAETFIQKLETDKRIRELATNPLLLTLLCLVFEDAADFPTNRSELYEEGLDVLLKKWDAKRNIERDRVYKKLSRQRKEDLLSHLAYTFFERGEYFFKQQIAINRIIQFIRNAPNTSQDDKNLELDGLAVLKSIEAQHGLLIERARGIYSFSHLTFQEYFTARQIKEQRSDALLEDLANHVAEKHWREVFLLTVGMLPDATRLLQLMKAKTDRILAGDFKLQQYLNWVIHKSNSVDVPYKPAAVRASYFAFAHALDLDLNLAHALDLDLDLAHALDLELDFDRDLNLDRDLDQSLDLNLAHALDLALKLKDRNLQHNLQELSDQLPDTSWENREQFKIWWKANGQAWTNQLRTIMIEHRNIGHDWQFSKEEKERSQQYYDANKLLVDCMNSECYVSPEVRQEIEATLLLPIAEIEKRQQA